MTATDKRKRAELVAAASAAAGSSAPAPYAPTPRAEIVTAAEALEARSQAPLPADPLAEFFYREDEEAVGIDLPEEEADGPEAPEEPPREYLGFRLAEEIYAIELSKVREIAKVPPITEVPRAPSFVMGVMNLRGEVMPVFDLHKRLGLVRHAPCNRSARVVVVETGLGPAGLLVEAVEQVVRLRSSTIEAPPPGLGAGLESDYLLGIGRDRDRMFVLLNLSSVLGLPGTEPR
ncbi:MAG: purine-binding chemotaxis protein CheW [Deltaproteobacteria bacterium]|nr:purine-binding chemotaxis protein CheW [Deltaproteobacteria bacterium]